MYMPVVTAILTRNKDIAVDSETVCLWLVDHSFDCSSPDDIFKSFFFLQA